MTQRILGVDYGLARVGLALTDPLGITAQPYRTLERTSDRQVCRAIAAIVAEKGVEEVVVGLPLDMSGEMGEAARNVESFVQRLARHVRVPIRLWDERLTTVQADRELKGGGASRSRRQELVDQVAASLLLQSVLASRQSPKPDEGG